MTTETTSHRFDAAIIGKEVRGQKVMLKLDWKLPGSKFEFTLYVDPNEADALNVGERLNWSIVRGNLKEGKDDKYPTNFWWEWDKDGSAVARVSPTVYEDNVPAMAEDRFDEPEDESQDGFSHALPTESQPGLTAKEKVDELFAQKPDHPEKNTQRAPVSPNAGPPPNPAAVGACANHAVDLIKLGVYPIPEGRSPESWICEKRDGLYWNVNQVDVKPPHWCYEHGLAFQKGKTGYGHREEDGWCVEGTPGIVVE